jgi:galactose-1-phosphate uridylyltransferase
MGNIKFDHFEDTFEVLNPLIGFKSDVQRVEVRRDPLSGRTSVYNPLIETRSKMFVADADFALLRQLAEESAAHCFFCPNNIDKVARFPAELVPQGTVRRGETVLFPNLFALAKYHAVAAVSHSHFLELHQFTPGLIADAFLAMHELVTCIYRQDTAPLCATVNANYLFPAGASLMHPHFQLLLSTSPYTEQANLLEGCRDYFAEHGSAYHPDLVRIEKAEGERYIAQTGAWHWLAAYSPLGSNEILGIHEQCGDFGRLTDADLTALAEGLSAALRVYESLGYLSFNFTLYSRRDPESPDGFNCLIRCMTRQNPYPNYRTDDFFLQKGLQTEVILTLPEKLAAQARPFFA